MAAVGSIEIHCNSMFSEITMQILSLFSEIMSCRWMQGLSFRSMALSYIFYCTYELINKILFKVRLEYVVSS